MARKCWQCKASIPSFWKMWHIESLVPIS
jgi:hypothetical protein